MKKKIFVINANPKTHSFCKSIAELYSKTVEKHHDVKLIHIGELHFQESLAEGYDESLILETDLVLFQDSLLWADHIVIVCPVWWGAMPAKFKALIDRTFLPGFAFQYTKGKSIPEKLLKGRRSELIFTLDTPTLWYKLVQGNPIYKNLKRTILDFVGIENINTHYFGPVLNSQDRTRRRWLEKIRVRAMKV